MSFVAALAVADLACAFLPPSLVRLKWPNDVRVAGAKVSGVLIESGARAGSLWLAIGIGVNLAHAPAGLDQAATSLADHLAPAHARPPTPREALDVLAGAFARWSEVWARQGFPAIAAAWSERAELGGPVEARLAAETVRGVSEALEPDGALRLRLADGTARRITAGDVFPLAATEAA